MQYRPGTHQNPIINESTATMKSDIHFPGDDYVMVELPQMRSGRDRVRYNNHCLVFGGRKRVDDTEPVGDLTRVYRAHISRIDKTFRFDKESFRFQKAIPSNLDAFFTLLR